MTISNKKKSVVFTGEPADYIIKAYIEFLDSIASHVSFSHFIYAFFRKGWDSIQYNSEFKDDKEFLKFAGKLSDKDFPPE